MRHPGSRSPEPTALVVGAGAAGLAAAQALQRAGQRPLVIDSAPAPGASWRRRYDGLRLNTVRRMSSLPRHRMSRSVGAWPSADDYADYLTHYASATGLALALNTEATRVDPRNGQWLVNTENGQLTSSTVVIATGHDKTPQIPGWTGRDTFVKPLVHAADFRNATPFVDLDVLVVGAGSSGCEIAAHLARGGARSVRLSVRTGPLILARRYVGVPLTYWSYPAKALPDWVLDRAGPLLQRLAFGDLTCHGLPRPGGGRTLSAQRRSEYIPTVDGEFVETLQAGAVTPVAAVDHLTDTEVVLADGTRLTPDAVITATGYTPGLESLVGHLDVLDPDGLPRALQPAPGLFFAGYRFDLSAGLPYFKRQARDIAAQRRVA